MSYQLTYQLSIQPLSATAVIVTVANDNPNAQNIITIENLGFYSNLTLVRVIDSVETEVRGAAGVSITGLSDFIVFDYECPLDVPVYYKAIMDTEASFISNTVTIVTDGRTFWLKDVIMGVFSAKVNIEDMSDVVRPSNVLGTYKVIGRANPIMVTDVRQGRTGTMVLTAFSTLDADAIMNLIVSGDTLLLQCPGSANFPDMYFEAGDVTESWNGGTANNIVHSFTIPFTESDAPAQTAIALGFNNWLLVAQFETWQNVLDKRATWTDVLVTPFAEADAL